MAPGELPRGDANAARPGGRRRLGWRPISADRSRRAPLARANGSSRVDGAHLAARVRRRRPLRGAGGHPARGDAPTRVSPASEEPGPVDARARAREVRQRDAEARASAEDRARRDALVPGLQRARSRLRPGRAAHAGGARRRRVRRRRPEDLDFPRPPRRLDVLSRADRSPGSEAQGHHVSPDRHAHPRHQRAPDPAHQRFIPVLRDPLRGCARARSQRRRQAPRRLGGRQGGLAARARAHLRDARHADGGRRFARRARAGVRCARRSRPP